MRVLRVRAYASAACDATMGSVGAVSPSISAAVSLRLNSRDWDALALTLGLTLGQASLRYVWSRFVVCDGRVYSVRVTHGECDAKVAWIYGIHGTVVGRR